MFDDIDLKKLIEMLDPTDISVVQIKTNDFELLLSRESLDGLESLSGRTTKNHFGQTSAVELKPSASAERAVPAAQATAENIAVTLNSGNDVVSKSPTQASSVDVESLNIVESPLVGIFYRASSPGAPPYVEVGQQVESDTTVGLIETMKVFTAIQAGRRGVVREILVENGQVVENGTQLVILEEN